LELRKAQDHPTNKDRLILWQKQPSSSQSAKMKKKKEIITAVIESRWRGLKKENQLSGLLELL
jgi:hypothetical protein